jgi:glycosyltransferase involved in cell wall biosynthesis
VSSTVVGPEARAAESGLASAGRPRVSACIITLNEEANIEECLRSVSWVDEIVVIDSESTDRTVEICERFGARVERRPFPGHIEQKNHAVRSASNPWVLCIDADERLSPALSEEIQRELGACGDDVDGWYMPRHTFYLGRWIDHGGWYPDYKLRLFRKDKGEWGGTNPHDRVVLAGKTKILQHDLLHFTYRDLAHHVRTINSFTTIMAQERHRRGRAFALPLLVLKPFFKFLKMYVWQRGFLDGLPGFVIAVSGAYYVFLTDAKLWELERFGGRGKP